MEDFTFRIFSVVLYKYPNSSDIILSHSEIDFVSRQRKKDPV